MIILAISTSSNICSVCLLDNDICIKELNICNSKTHSENLMPLIDQLLTETKTSLNVVNLIACDNGPGSFTGIRIGIATIKAIAEVYNIPIASVSSLEALAYNIKNSNNNICSLIDAKNNQVYSAVFDKNYNKISNFLADDINIILENFKNFTPLTFVGDASCLFQELLQQSELFDNAIHSFNIGICGYKKFLNNDIQNADSVLPMYLRKSQAERMKLQNG